MTLQELMTREARNEGGSGTRGRDLEGILKVVQTINSSLVLPEVLEIVIDEALRITGAQRGFLMLADANRKLEFVVGRDARGNTIPAERFQVSSIPASAIPNPHSAIGTASFFVDDTALVL